MIRKDSTPRFRRARSVVCWSRAPSPGTRAIRSGMRLAGRFQTFGSGTRLRASGDRPRFRRRQARVTRASRERSTTTVVSPWRTELEVGGTVSITDIGSAHKGDNFEINPGGANPESVGSSGGRPGIAYEPVGGKFVCWNGLGNLYRLNVPAGFRNGTEDPSQPITVTSGWEWELVPGIIGAPPDAVSSGVYTKFHYIDSIQCLATQAFVESDMHVFKVPANGL